MPNIYLRRTLKRPLTFGELDSNFSTLRDSIEELKLVDLADVNPTGLTDQYIMYWDEGDSLFKFKELVSGANLQVTYERSTPSVITTNDTNGPFIIKQGGTGNLFTLLAANNDTILNVTNGGYIGINTNSPLGALHVNGLGSKSATWTAQFHNSTGTSNTMLLRDDGRVIWGSNTFTLGSARYEFHGVINQVLPGTNNTIQFGGSSQTTSPNSVIIGRDAASNTTVKSIVVIGYAAARSNTSSGGLGFVAIGSQAARNGSSGVGFVAVGCDASRFNDNSDASYISLGYRSAYNAVGGGFATNYRWGIYIGTSTLVSHPTNLISNEIVIGYQGQGLGSNTTSIGNSSTTHTNLFGNLTLGTTTNTSGRLQVWGSGSTSATWTAQFHNSTGSSNTLMIRDDGRIGLGTATPQTRLEIVENGFSLIQRTTSSTGYVSQRYLNDRNSMTRSLEIGYGGSAFASALVINGIVGETGYLTTTGNYALQFGVNNRYAMAISATTGNVLINRTVDVGYKLDVNGGVRIQGDMTIESGAMYFGDKDTDGSWRITRNGTDLEIQIRVGGTYITKGSFTP